ncbi:MAG: hypothetical protein P9L94_13470 [Candidatus Hinthialibacter antarcticus]|nr:hypothetical protein [Candidatus Hinthialibacter antarcticus]
MIEKGLHSSDQEKVAAAQKLQTRLEEILNDDNHRWFLNKQTPEEIAEREKRQKEFQARYSK